MRNVRRARYGLSAAFSIAFALSLTVYAGPAARAFTCQDAIYTSGIAYTGASVVIVASPQRQNGGNLFYFWQKGGTGSWQKEQVASGNDCPNNQSGWTLGVPTGYRSSAIAWTGSSVVIAALDQRDGGIYYWWQPSGGTTWNQQTVAAGPPGCCSFGSVVNGVTTPYLVGYSVPSIAWTGRSVVIAAIDKNGLHYWFQEKGQTTWYHELVSSQDGSTHPTQPSIAWTGTSVVIADACNAGLCYYWQQAGTAPWHRQVVDTGSGDGYPSIAWSGSAVVIAAVQDPGNIVYWSQAAGTATWHKQQVNTNGAREFSAPSIAWARGNPVIVATDDTVNSASAPTYLDYWWQSGGSSGAWNLQHPDGGNGNYSGWTDPRSIALAGGSIVITTTDACGDLDYWWQQIGSPTWHEQRVNTNGGWPAGTLGCG